MGLTVALTARCQRQQQQQLVSMSKYPPPSPLRRNFAKLEMLFLNHLHHLGWNFVAQLEELNSPVNPHSVPHSRAHPYGRLPQEGSRSRSWISRSLPLCIYSSLGAFGVVDARLPALGSRFAAFGWGRRAVGSICERVPSASAPSGLLASLHLA